MENVNDPQTLDKYNIFKFEDDYQFLPKEQVKMSQLKLKRAFYKQKIEELTENIAYLKNIHSPKKPKKSNSTKLK